MGSVFQRVRLNYFRITLLNRYLNWLSRRITIIARRLLYNRFQPPLPGKNLQSSLLPLREFFSSARIPYHMHEPYCVCEYYHYVCMHVLVAFSDLQFYQDSGSIGSLFAIFYCRGIFNVHTGPASLSPVSEKAGHSIHYPRIRDEFPFFSPGHFTTRFIRLLIPFKLYP